MEIIFSLLQAYPLSIPDTLAIVSVIWLLLQHLIKMQWDKLAKVAEETAMPLFDSIMANEQKRDKVLLAMYAVTPGWFKLLVKFEQVDAFFDNIYATKIKPTYLRDKSGKLIEQQQNDDLF